MPYLNNHVLLGIHGVFGTSAAALTERWTVTLRINHGVGVVSDTALATFLAAAEVPIKAHHVTSAVKAGTTCWLTHLTAAPIGTDGKYVGGGTQATVTKALAPAAAGLGTQLLPNTAACVRSLRTALLRGPASNGRMYYPATALVVAASESGRITTTEALNIATATATMIAGIGTHAAANFPAPAYPAVLSRVGNGASAQITGIRVGRRLDNMESRERDIAEDWQFADVPDF